MPTVEPKRSLHKRRIRSLTAITLLILTALSVRLLQLQVVQAGELGARAHRQWTHEIEMPARRGTIYDRDGAPLALSVEAADVYATPYQLERNPATASTLASCLGQTPAFWEEKLSRGGGFVWLARRVDAGRAQALKNKKVPGIGFIPSSRRSYRIGAVASQVVGLSGIDGTGLAGLEVYYQRVLAGRSGSIEAQRDPFGRTLPGGLLKSVEPVDGHSIEISLDSDIQYKAQLELEAGIKAAAAKGGAIVVLDPRTGAILAAASSPGADPDKITPKTIMGLKNRVVTDVFEPGSTMKIVTVGAALEEGAVRPGTRFVLPPTISIGGHTVHEAHARGTVDYTVSDILAESSNVGAVTIGLRLGKQRLYRYIERFGLTESTGVDLPGEAVGWVPKPNLWSATSIGTIPFGQGIVASPLQMARVMATVANDGVMTRMHFMTSEVGEPTAPVEGQRVISTDTARALRSMLLRAVEIGTGKLAQIPGYTVGGKTGTAQKPIPGGKGYATGAYLASFVGLAPVSKPRVVCLVAIDEPQNTIYGGAVAAPVFGKVVRFALSHLEVPPDAPKGGRR
jgi:cell division protein FtsI/penicillin-binding protein 2